MGRTALKWVQHAIDVILRGERCGLVSILAVEGSTPREAGTRMVVTHQDALGTIGGGKLELQAVSQARMALELPPGTWRIQDYPLGPLLGQCCGGRVRLLIEHLKPESIDWLRQVASLREFVLESQLTEFEVLRSLNNDSTKPQIDAGSTIPDVGAAFTEKIKMNVVNVVMFGSGHVGQAVARVLEVVECDVKWFDCRQEYAAIPNVQIVSKEEMVQRAACSDHATLVLTHDHQLDYDLVRSTLGSSASFIGLIGSKTKRERFMNRLAKEGFDETVRNRVVCPIGLPQIQGKDPGTIAVAVVAQILSRIH